MYIYIYACVHVHTYLCIYVSMYLSIYLTTYLPAYLHIYIHQLLDMRLPFKRRGLRLGEEGCELRPDKGSFRRWILDTSTWKASGLYLHYGLASMNYGPVLMSSGLVSMNYGLLLIYSGLLSMNSVLLSMHHVGYVEMKYGR